MMFVLHGEHSAQKACYRECAISDFCAENMHLSLITSLIISKLGCLKGKRAVCGGRVDNQVMLRHESGTVWTSNTHEHE